MNRLQNPSTVTFMYLGHADASDARPAAHEPEQNAWRLRQYRARVNALVVATHTANPDIETQIARRHDAGARLQADKRGLWSADMQRRPRQVGVLEWLGAFNDLGGIVEALGGQNELCPSHVASISARAVRS